MSFSIAMFSLVLALGANIAPGQLSWERDYRLARELGVRLKKPLAVFVGSGSEGWCQLAREGKLDHAVQKTLADNYVRVYLDRRTESGREVAAAFGIDGKCGLVISDRTGGLQAFWHQGELSLTELSQVLTRYGSPDFVVRTTETHHYPAQTEASYVQPASYQNYFQPTCRT